MPYTQLPLARAAIISSFFRHFYKEIFWCRFALTKTLQQYVFRIEDVTHESTRLRCQLNLLLADKQQHHVTLQHMHKSIKDLKEQLKNKTEV